MHSSTQASGAALVTVALWASAFPFIRVGLRGFAPIPLAALRFAVAAALVVLWLLVARPRLPSLRDLLRLAACAAIGIAAYNILLNSGQRSVSAAAASFIVNTVPVLTAVLAIALLGERFGLRSWLGTAVSFGGIALIASGQPGGLSLGAGAVLVFAAALCQAVFFILQRPLVTRYGGEVCGACVIVLGGLCLAPWLPEALAEAQRAPVEAVAAVVYLGLFPAAIGYASWGVAQAHFGASRAANFLYLVPPFATILALLITAEIPSTTTLAGGVLAVAGVIVVNRPKK